MWGPDTATRGGSRLRGAWAAMRALSLRRVSASLLVIGAACVLLAGCAGSGVGQTQSGAGSLLSTLESWSALQTPVYEAQGILTQHCMAQHGYRFYPFPQQGEPGGPQSFFATPLFGTPLWLGPQSLAWRLVNGWGLYEETMQQLGQPGGLAGQPAQESLVMQSLRGRAMQRYMRTLYGGGKSMKIRIPGMPHFTVRIGGCNTTAGAQLFGSVTAAIAVPGYGQTILAGSIQSRAARSPALRQRRAAWAACVVAHTGIRVSSPSQLLLHFYALYQRLGPTPAVHRRELEAAVADWRCQRATRLAPAVRQAELAAVRRLPGSVVGEIETLLSAVQQARTRAQAVFAHPSTSGLDGAPAAGRSSGSQAAGAPAGIATAGASVSRTVVGIGG